MELRKGNPTDANDILGIIKQAQDYFKIQGINQWQNGYPNLETIKHDIHMGYNYVLLKEKVIIGTVALGFDGEKTYNNIYNGKWRSNQSYAVIHRLAVDSEYKGSGIASIIINKIEELCIKSKIKSIRVDTHKDNRSMQNLLHKNGFVYCGIILLEDKSERLAYEKILG